MLRAALALLALLIAPVAAAAQVPDGAVWTSEYVEYGLADKLHVDLLRPEGLPSGATTPAIVIASPYMRHADDARASERLDAPQGEPDEPSARVFELLDGAGVFARGYSVALVDLPGSGGSTGCYDHLGPGEQAAIRAAVEWAADAPWSTGRVGLFGKSYDGMAGVAAAALRPRGLHAVVAQEVEADLYRSHYAPGGLRKIASVSDPVMYGANGETGLARSTVPQDDTPYRDGGTYALNSASPGTMCGTGSAGMQSPDPDHEFWRDRDFVELGRGSGVPFFMTAGFLDTNTELAAGAIEFFNGLTGPKRLWLGPWDHVAGHEVDAESGDLAMGRSGWFDEVMRFYDEHLKQIAPATQDPGVVVQGSDGTWRSETAWPPADAEPLTAPLKSGTYTDDGRNMGSRVEPNTGWPVQVRAATGEPTGEGVWTVSPPLPHRAHLAGTPVVTPDLDVELPNANVVVNVYDIAPDGAATMIGRGARLVGGDGPAEVTVDPADWTFEPGHRIGVLVSGANAEAWMHVPTERPVSVRGGSMELPFLAAARTSNLAGTAAPALGRFRTAAPFPVGAGVLAAATEPSLVPPPQS